METRNNKTLVLSLPLEWRIACPSLILQEVEAVFQVIHVLITFRLVCYSVLCLGMKVKARWFNKSLRCSIATWAPYPVLNPFQVPGFNFQSPQNGLALMLHRSSFSLAQHNSYDQQKSRRWLLRVFRWQGIRLPLWWALYSGVFAQQKSL